MSETDTTFDSTVQSLAEGAALVEKHTPEELAENKRVFRKMLDAAGEQLDIKFTDEDADKLATFAASATAQFDPVDLFVLGSMLTHAGRKGSAAAIAAMIAESGDVEDSPSNTVNDSIILPGDPSLN